MTLSSTKPPVLNAACFALSRNMVGTGRISSPIRLSRMRSSSTCNGPVRRPLTWLMYVISRRRLGLPQESRDAFTLLQTAGILPTDLATRMQRMVAFRNVAVHEYARLNLDIVHTIITKHLDDFRAFSSTIVKTCA